MKKFIIPVGVWKADVIIWIATIEEAKRSYRKTIYYNQTPDQSFMDGFTLYEPGNPPVVWINSQHTKNDKIAIAVHEFTHLVIRMLLNKGMMAIDETDEAHAYFMEHLTSELLKKI